MTPCSSLQRKKQFLEGGQSQEKELEQSCREKFMDLLEQVLMAERELLLVETGVGGNPVLYSGAPYFLLTSTHLHLAPATSYSF